MRKLWFEEVNFSKVKIKDLSGCRACPLPYTVSLHGRRESGKRITQLAVPLTEASYETGPLHSPMVTDEEVWEDRLSDFPR